MTEEKIEKITVYPFGGWVLSKGPQGEVIATIEYVVADRELKTQEEFDEYLQSLTVRMSPERASEFGSEIWRTAEKLMQARPQ